MFLRSSPLGQGVLPIVPTPPRTHLPYHFLFLWFFCFFFAPQNPNFLSTILYNWLLFRGLAPRVSSESALIIVEIHKVEVNSPIVIKSPSERSWGVFGFVEESAIEGFEVIDDPFALPGSKWRRRRIQLNGEVIGGDASTFDGEVVAMDDVVNSWIQVGIPWILLDMGHGRLRASKVGAPLFEIRVKRS